MGYIYVCVFVCILTNFQVSSPLTLEVLKYSIDLLFYNKEKKEELEVEKLSNNNGYQKIIADISVSFSFFCHSFGYSTWSK